MLQVQAVLIMFLHTDWAWANPGYALLLLFPVYSLINSRQIVCNVTKMEMSILPLSCYWFTLFSVNRYAVYFLPRLEQYARAQQMDGSLLLVEE